MDLSASSYGVGMRVIGLGTRGVRRVRGGRLLGLGLGALVLGALIGLGWALADASSRAEAAEGVLPAAGLLGEVDDVVSPVVDPVVEEASGRIDPVAAKLLSALGRDASAGEKRTGSADLVGELVNQVVDAPSVVAALTTPAETSAPPARGVLRDLTATLAALTGAPGEARTEDVAVTGGSGEAATVVAVSGPVERAGAAAHEAADRIAPRSGSHPTTISTGRADHAPPAGPAVPPAPCPDAGAVTGGAGVGRCSGGGEHGDGAVMPTAGTWLGAAQSDVLLAAGAQTPPAECASEHTVAPD